MVNYDWLVVDLPLWKMMEWKSVGKDYTFFITEHKSHAWNHQPYKCIGIRIPI